MSQRPPDYPLRFKEIIRNYEFGRRWIAEAFAKTGLPDDPVIAETWEVCDRPSGVSSLILNGHMAGLTLRQAIDRCGGDLLGRQMVERFGTIFPLLIKFLDASHPLGEQVHCNDQIAKARGLKDFFGKTEAWYMLRTQPSATVRCGNIRGMTNERAREAFLQNTAPQCMTEYTVEPGDAFLLYAGTMHYSAGGVLFYEVMQNSDVVLGLRLNQARWTAAEQQDRANRAVEALHLEDDFDCHIPPVSVEDDGWQRTFVLACREFALERLEGTQAYAIELDGRRFEVLSVVEGSAVMETAGGSESLYAGQSCLLPAGLQRVTLHPQGRAVVLRTYVPDLELDIVRPLRRAGISRERIESLGGRTRLNPLRGIL